MININSLDNVIALVVVILLLSLIVQSIQGALKKALKIKSRQIEDSLVDLFENVAHYDREAAAPAGTEGAGASRIARVRAWAIRVSGSSPVLRRVYQTVFRRIHPSDPSAHPNPEVRMLFGEVTKGFQQVGRVAQTGKRMLDSVSKEDLKKVMGKVLPNSLLPDFTERLAAACAYVAGIDEAVKDINDNYLAGLGGDASAKFAAAQQALAPLLNDLRAIYNGKEVSPALVIDDIASMRDIKLGDALKTLGETQQRVEDDLRAAKKAEAYGDTEAPGRVIILTGLSAGLGRIARSLTGLNAGLDAALAPLRAKLGEVETWYDTVMQSFEERYTRGMKTWAIVISFLVVAYLNANVFTIYKNVSNSEDLRTRLTQLGEERVNARAASAQKNAGRSAATQAEEDATVKALTTEIDDIRRQANEYSSLGFQPLTWQKVKAELTTFRPSENWLSQRGDDIKTLFGWAVMTLLLSVGAPFWQDTLESLFGVKNLLRKGSSTKNVEAESGAGQPRS